LPSPSNKRFRLLARVRRVTFVLFLVVLQRPCNVSMAGPVGTGQGIGTSITDFFFIVVEGEVAQNPDPAERQIIASSAILRKFFFKASSSGFWPSNSPAKAFIPNKPDCFW